MDPNIEPRASSQYATMVSTLMPALPLRMPSGPAFPRFVYRFVDKLFHLDCA